MPERSCLQCSRPFTTQVGRGGKSNLCGECQAERKRLMTAMRGQRHLLAGMTEIIETIGPRIYLMRKEVTEKQDKKCSQCGRTRRLYLAGSERGELFGLCLEDFGDWAATRRGRHDR